MRATLSSKNCELPKFGHFMLLFYRGRLRNLQRFIMHMQSYCFAHLNLLFGGVLIACVNRETVNSLCGGRRALLNPPAT